jgi:uncharacterized membrane protein HdeD (DUF308 family)
MAASAAPATPLDPDASAGRYWWLPLALGVVTMLAGLVALAYPGPTLLVVCLIVGVYLIIWGAMTLVRGVGDAGTGTLLRVVLVLVGALTVIAGLIVLVRPGESVLTIAWVVGVWWVFVGVMQLVGGIVEPADRIWNLALGALGIVAGAIILAQPAIGLITLVWIVAIVLLVQGAVEIAAGLKFRKLHKAGVI